MKRRNLAILAAAMLPVTFVGCGDDDDGDVDVDVETPDLDPGEGTGLPGDEG